MSREYTLDFSRFVAASIVFIGHMLFLPSTFFWKPETVTLLDPVRTGDTAVLFFFALSGYVLAVSTEEAQYFNWVKRRLIRLFPVYITAWMFGLVLMFMHNLRLPNSAVLVLGVSGISAIGPEFNLNGNSPLWSLSVEIIYALFLFYLLKLRNKPLLMLCALSLSLGAWYFFTEVPILRATPYFLIGIFLRNQWIVVLKVRRSVCFLFVITVAIFYVLHGASWLLALPYSVEGEVSKLIAIGALIFFLSKIRITGSLAKFSAEAGKRSFCLYAFHYPVLLIFNYFIEPNNKISMLFYVLLSTVVTLCLTEFTYRFIDIPSTKQSQRLRK